MNDTDIHKLPLNSLTYIHKRTHSIGPSRPLSPPGAAAALTTSSSQKSIDLNSMRVSCSAARHTPASTALILMRRRAINAAWPASSLPQNSHHLRSNLTTPNATRSMSSYVDGYVVGAYAHFPEENEDDRFLRGYSNTRAYIQVLLLQGGAMRGATLKFCHRSDYKDIGNLFLILHRAELLLHLYYKFTADTGSHRSRFTFSSENSSFKNPP
ncbi:hypothetical protein M0R45_009162 [Rubus argutus]|uniref:Uncharacterized protein n=1 Tax=Rubus argutus TaxID=59490 RepID=A0AAW1Y6N4_RUBAR